MLRSRGHAEVVLNRAPFRRGSGLLTVLLVGCATVGVQALTVVTGVISARLLGVEGRGQLALVAAASALFARLTMAGSLPVSVSQLLARSGLTARDGLAPFVGRWAGLALLPALASGCYVGWLLRADTPLAVGLGTGTAVLTYQAIASGLLGAGIQGELASIRRVAAGAILLALPFPVVLVAAVVVTDVDDPFTVTALLAGSGVVGLALNVLLLRPAEGRASTLDRAEIRRTSRANYVAAVGTVNGLGLDRNLVGVWFGTYALGLYAVGAAFANLSSIIGNGIASLLLPRLSALSDPAEQDRLARRWMGATAAVLVVMVAAVEAVLAPLVRVAFGEEFVPAVELARWLVLADGLLGFRRLPICLLQARGRGGLASTVELVVTVAVVAAIAGAAWRGDLTLVAVAMAAGGALSLVLLWAALRTTRERPALRAADASAAREGR